MVGCLRLTWPGKNFKGILVKLQYVQQKALKDLHDERGCLEDGFVLLEAGNGASNLDIGVE